MVSIVFDFAARQRAALIERRSNHVFGDRTRFTSIDVAPLKLNERISFVSAHTCSVVNFTDHASTIDSVHPMTTNGLTGARGALQ